MVEVLDYGNSPWVRNQMPATMMPKTVKGRAAKRHRFHCSDFCSSEGSQSCDVCNFYKFFNLFNFSTFHPPALNLHLSHHLILIGQRSSPAVPHAMRRRHFSQVSTCMLSLISLSPNPDFPRKTSWRTADTRNS